MPLANSHPSATPTPPAPDPFHFDPTPAQADAAFMALSDPNTCLAQVASNNNISVEALTLWMARPDVSARLDALDHAFARRARLTLSNNSASVICAVSRVIEEFQYAESHLLYRSSDLKGHELSRKNRETALKAAHYYLRLARHFAPAQTPAPARARRDATPAPSPVPPQAEPAPAAPTDPAPLDLFALRAARCPDPSPSAPSDLQDSPTAEPPSLDESCEPARPASCQDTRDDTHPTPSTNPFPRAVLPPVSPVNDAPADHAERSDVFDHAEPSQVFDNAPSPALCLNSS